RRPTPTWPAGCCAASVVRPLPAVWRGIPRSRSSTPRRCGRYAASTATEHAHDPGRTRPRRSGLADGPAQVDEPLGGRVEGPATGDTIQLDRAQLVPALHVLTDDARAARQRGLDRQIGATGDQLQ